MHRLGSLIAVTATTVIALSGCAGGPLPGDRLAYVRGVADESPKQAHAQFEQQLVALVTQLTDSLGSGRTMRIAVLPFENTTDRNAETMGAYLTEKITNLLYISRVGTVVERTYLNKVLDEIARGYSGPFDPLSFKEIGHLLNADTLVSGSYTKLNNGITEIMVRAVSVETGEVVGAATAAVSSNLVPNAPIIERRPVLVQNEAAPPNVPSMDSGSGWTTADVQSGGSYSVAPTPSPGMAYSSFLSVPAPLFSLYGYNYVPRIIYSYPPVIHVPTWHPPASSPPGSAYFRPGGSGPSSSSRSFGHRGRR